MGTLTSTDRSAGIRDLRSHTARGMLINAAFQIGVLGTSALRGVIVANFLTRAEYGVWGLVSIALWTALGLKSVFGAGEKYVQQSDENQEHAFQRAFTVELLFAAVTAPIAAGWVVAYTVLTGKAEVLAPGMVLLLLLPSTALQFPLAAFYRRMDYKRQRILGAVDPLLAAVTTVALAIAGAGYWSFIGGALVGSWAAAFVALRASPFRVRLRYDRGMIGQYARFSIPLVVSGLAVLALFQFINIAGVSVLGLAGIGVFTLVGNLVQFTDQADTIITNTLYPAICAVRDRAALLSEMFVKSNRLSLMWAVPFGVGLTLFASDLVHFVLGRQWLPATALLEIMGLVTAVHHVGYNWAAFVKARGITWPIAVSALLVCLTVMAAALPLMHSDGVKGLGYAFAIGECVALVTRGIWLARFFHKVSFLVQLVRAFAPTAVAAASVLLVRSINGTETTWAAAVGVFALYVLTTMLATLALEQRLLREALGYLIRKRESAVVAPTEVTGGPLAPAISD